MDPRPRYWFPAKAYGWGWGAPRTWEGWAVLAAYLLVAALPPLLLPDRPALTLLGLVVGTPLLLWVCVKKGEPPRWRWGRR